MQKTGDGFLFSASDLMRFAGCAHCSRLDLLRAEGKGPEPRADDAEAQLLQRQGNAHEASHLDALKARGLSVVEISRDGLSLAQGVEQTRAALAQGPDIIFQGALAGGPWGGWSDFLERVERPSKLGSYSYEVADTKLKRRPDPKHLLQLVLYSDLLAELQGAVPEFAHVELGNGTRATFRLADYAAYARHARARLEQFVEECPETRPRRCVACTLCRWQDHCQSVWDAEDSLFNVANITSLQIARLEAEGITSMAALAKRDTPIRRMAPATQERLVAQARLQQARKSGDPAFALRPAQSGKGFDLLPEPREGDVFYDIEGDPHYDGGLEYLHGLWADGTFTAFWAHDHDQEAQALAALMDWFRTRLAQYPEARIYHYAPYEVTALKRLTQKYGIAEAFLDRLLRERRFVDLYAVVRGGLIASEKNYSIKSMEAFYRGKRDGEVTTSGGSVVAYEAWRESGDAEILEEIRAYNEVDCVSTEELRNWLVSIRPDGPWPVLGAAADDKEEAEEEKLAELRTQLAASDLPAERQKLLFDLAQYHQREAKPAWWAIHDSLSKETDELIDATEALGGLVPIGPAEPVKQSLARRFRFPPQETKLRAGGNPVVGYREEGGFDTLTVTEFDPRAREVVLKIGKARSHLLDRVTALHPQQPLKTQVIEDAIRQAIDDQCDLRKFRAVDDLLSRAAPRFLSGQKADILGRRDPVEGTVAAIMDMDEAVLPIQGPPGTGKTYVTARAILALVRAGKRVAVASTSHEAIRNVLMGVIKAHDWGDPDFTIAHKLTEDGYPDDCPIVRTNDNDDAVLADAEIVGGTVFYFARPGNRQAFDHIFVDEAGQVGLANMVALATAARNVVMVGDPRQLPQVVQGSHPAPAHLSCLEWMQGDAPAIPAHRGIFLPVSRRMHPEVCRFISDQVYGGALDAHEETARQGVSGVPGLPNSGAHLVPVPHEGNAQMAPEEIDAIAGTARRLLAGQWTGRDGATRPITEADIIVVAPYNIQVNALRRSLPQGIRVGTVDKFQGQEAPICLVSMTTSSAEDMPRGLDFLLSINRINVAISRAKGLALVFAAPRLLEAKVTTVEEMALVNTLCSLAEQSQEFCIERTARRRRN